MADPTYATIDEAGNEYSRNGKKAMLAWQRANPKRSTDTLILNATGRTLFVSREERREWEAIQEQALGATDAAIMHDAWIKEVISWAVRENTKAHRIVRKLTWVLKVIQNNNLKTDWVSSNFKRIMKERADSVKESFFDND